MLKMTATLALLFAMTASLAAHAEVRGFNLTEIGDFVYDAANNGQPKTAAQEAVDYIYSLGARHVVLNPEARMVNATDVIVIPKVGTGPALANERMRYIRLINYIKSKGMTVGIRPIFLVQNTEAGKYWHGNIRPADPRAWFQSFRTYMMNYVAIAKLTKAEEFTVGAELFSMTVGIEDQWKEQPFGFPREYGILVNEIRGQLGAGVRLMYDANYTDVSANDDGTGAGGGEIERWRYRLADLKPDPAKPATMTPASQQAWTYVKDLWNSFDAIGIDMYRSLLPRSATVPSDYAALVQALETQTAQYATDLDAKLFDIQMAVGGNAKSIVLKEIGFKSCTKCFIDPGVYDDPRLQVNIPHQAASYQAIFNAFAKPGWGWYGGISFWDISVNPGRAGERDPGFTPRGKALTEQVVRSVWGK